MNHFRNKFTSPLISICTGYVYIVGLAIILHLLGFYQNSEFFRWGTPVKLMGMTIDDDRTYYGLLALFFVHQLINNWVNDVTYPWIINCVQDPKSDNLVYSRKTSMLIVNMFALYSELDMVFIISGVMSQISFFVAIILANMVSVTVINWQYIRSKKMQPSISESPLPLSIRDFRDLEPRQYNSFP